MIMAETRTVERLRASYGDVTYDTQHFENYQGFHTGTVERCLQARNSRVNRRETWSGQSAEV